MKRAVPIRRSVSWVRSGISIGARDPRPERPELYTRQGTAVRLRRSRTIRASLASRWGPAAASTAPKGGVRLVRLAHGGGHDAGADRSGALPRRTPGQACDPPAGEPRVSLVEALCVDLARLPTRDLVPVDVAVLDTGIDATHPDLAGRVIESFEIVADEDGRHRAAVTPHAANNDADGHGTGVASVIAAVAPNARIVDVRILGADDVETGAALLTAFQLAVLRRFRLVNLSLACHARYLVPLSELCERAYAQGQVVVAARRNTPLLEYGIPAQFSSCIGVDSDRFPSPYEFRFRSGSPIECIARGSDVSVAAPGGKYTVQSGTSFAAPAVTGLCALLLGRHPGLAPYEVKSVLKHLGGPARAG